MLSLSDAANRAESKIWNAGIPSCPGFSSSALDPNRVVWGPRPLRLSNPSVQTNTRPKEVNDIPVTLMPNDVV